MPRQLILGTGRKRLVVYAIAVLAFAVLFIPNAKAQMTWTVMVDVSSLNQKPVYTVAPPTGSSSCNYSAPTHPETLYVCGGDIVLFKATTRVPMGASVTYDLYVYPERTILIDSSTGNPLTVVHATASDNMGKGGKVSTDAKLLGTYEYHVAVVDENNGRLFVDDPKIVIGTGTSIYLTVNILETQCGDLHRLLSVGSDAQKQADKIADKMCEEIRTLKTSLQPQ
jgi:hypothetical protein